MTERQPPWAHLITLERIADLHAEAIQKYPGRPGGARGGCVESSLGAAWVADEYLGLDEGVPGLTFAAYLLFYLASNHCFVDGNKRIAWLAAIEVLAAFGLTLDVQDSAAYDFVDAVAKHEMNQEQARTWVARYATALDPEDR